MGRSMRRDWSDLPYDLIATISKLLTSIPDYLSFRGVCQSWRFAATLDNFDKSIPQMPWLMFMSTDKKLVTNANCNKSVKFVDLFNDNINMAFKSKAFPRYELGTKLFSCSGWILAVNEDCIQLELRHVTRAVCLELPSMDTFPGFVNWYLHERSDMIKFITYSQSVPSLKLYKTNSFIKKMAIITLPASKSGDHNLVVVVIWGEKKQLAYSRPGETSWTVMDLWEYSFSDVICHNGVVYALDFRLQIVACDVCGENPTKLQTVFRLSEEDVIGHVNTNYLVVDPSLEKFLIVMPIIDGCEFIEYFQLWECDLKLGSKKFIKDKRDKALFLGFNSSMCLQLPDSSSGFIRTDGVYYTDLSVYSLLYARIYDSYESVSEIKTGIYMYEDMEKEDCLPRHFSSHDDATVAPLLWVFPKL